MIFLFEIPQSYMGETVFVMQQTELGAGAEDDVGGKALWQPSQGHLLENFIPNSSFAFWLQALCCHSNHQT